VQVRRKNN